MEEDVSMVSMFEWCGWTFLGVKRVGKDTFRAISDRTKRLEDAFSNDEEDDEVRPVDVSLRLKWNLVDMVWTMEDEAEGVLGVICDAKEWVWEAVVAFRGDDEVRVGIRIDGDLMIFLKKGEEEEVIFLVTTAPPS